jgi:hypothetical protein
VTHLVTELDGGKYSMFPMPIEAQMGKTACPDGILIRVTFRRAPQARCVATEQETRGQGGIEKEEGREAMDGVPAGKMSDLSSQQATIGRLAVTWRQMMI